MEQQPNNIICLQTPAFYALIDIVVEHIDRSHGSTGEPVWIDGEEAKRLLNVSSNTTMQRLRDEGRIRFSSVGRKNLVYDKLSILKFLESNARDTF